MELAAKTGMQIIQMLIILLIGIYATKRKLIDSNGQKKLTVVLLEIVSPLIIFTSYQKEYSTKVLNNLITVVLLSFVSLIIAILVSWVFIKKTKKRDYLVERMAVMYSNCGFIGIPIMQALFQNDGVFYCTGFITAFNIICWSYGIVMLSKKKEIKLFNIIKGHNMIAIILGLICFISRIRIPSFINNPLAMVGSMNAPLAFLIIGASIGQIHPREIFLDRRCYLVVFYHNVLVPLIFIIFILFLDIDEMLKQIVLIATACPVGATTTTFSVMFNKDEKYASKLLANSTVLSILTIPFVTLIYTYISSIF